MPPALQQHPFGWQYIFLRSAFAVLRSFIRSAQWLGSSPQKVHNGVAYKRITIPSREDGRAIQVDMYQPPGFDSTKPTPVLVNFHGSGFALPSLGTDREFSSFVSSQNNILVLDCDYRKAPEHPFPAASQDTQDIVYHLLAHPLEYDASNIFLSGFSAGGNLALVTANVLGPERVKGVISFYPPIDLANRYEAPQKTLASGYVLPRWVTKLFDAAYIVPSQSASDPLISPLYASTSSFPKHVYLACGNADTLYTPVEKLAQNLKEAGHPNVEFLEIDFEGHSFDKDVKTGSASAERKEKAYMGAVGLIKRGIEETSRRTIHE